jgi:stearoyl-CoA desaturase (delta-9 desaturase)
MTNKINWYNTSFFTALPIIAVAGTVYLLLTHGLSMATLALAVFYIFATGLSITAGYHRLYSHATYKASWPVRLFYVLFGSGAFEGSVLEWSTDHRDHHRYTDQEKDPYDIKKGLWFAHMGWIIHMDTSRRTFKNVEDLKADPMLVWQHKYYLWIAISMGFILPMLLAASWGDALGGLFIAGALRMTVNHHFTFFINSFAHYFGKKTYNDLSARDNWFLALFTYGEGFHNFHHQFAIDYRNGIRWFHYDPSKWLIWTLSKLGLASQLKQVDEEIIAKAMMKMEEENLLNKKGVPSSRLEALAHPIREKLHNLHLQLISLRKQYAAYKVETTHHCHEKISEYKKAIIHCQKEFQMTLRSWGKAKKNLLQAYMD